MRSRLPARVPLAAWLLIGAVVAWRLPTIAFNVAAVVGIKARFTAEMLLVEVLFALRRDRTARRALAAIILRNRRALRLAKQRAQEW